MARIVLEAEGHMATQLPQLHLHHGLSIAETICESVAHAAYDLDMRAIAVFTETGTTARLISKYRPPAPIYAFAQDSGVANWLNVCWGVRPIGSPHAGSAEEMLVIAQRELLRIAAVAPGDVIGVVAGTIMASGSTNLMRLHVVEGPATGAPARPERRKRPRFDPLPRRRNL
jgi:pyruvate kinase